MSNIQRGRRETIVGVKEARTKAVRKGDNGDVEIFLHLIGQPRCGTVHTVICVTLQAKAQIRYILMDNDCCQKFYASPYISTADTTVTLGSKYLSTPK